MRANVLFRVGVVIGVVIAGPAAMADSIFLTQNSYSFSNGGEFTARTSPEDFLDSYLPATIVNGGFETFCVEASVYFHPGTGYYYTLSNIDSQGRVLTEGAAFLYSQFAEGALSGYDYFDSGNRRNDAGELQAAIWHLQGNQSGESDYPGGGAGNPFYDLAVNSLGADGVTAPDDGRYSVEILQLWDAANNACQNQLVVNPSETNVPEYSSSSLLAMGLAWAFFERRRIRR